MLVGGLRLGELTGEGIDVMMALAGAVDAIGPMQASVEPLRRIGRGDLRGEHVAHLVEERLRVRIGVEILALPAPIGPRSGKAIKDLRGGHLAAKALVGGQLGQRRLVGHGAPQERGNVVLLNPLQRCGHASFTEIFLRQYVASDLAPCRGHVDAVERKHHRAVRIADFVLGLAKLKARIG